MKLKKFDEIDWTTPDAEQFALYWRGLEPDADVPHRRSFDPMRISALLPFIAIYEVLSRDEIIYRLAGTAIVERFGKEVTGKNFLDFWEGEPRERTASSMYECVSRPCGIFSELSGTSESGGTESSVAVGFPLLDDSGACNRLVFYSTGFQMIRTRIPREDQIRTLSAARGAFIDLSR